MIARLLRGDRGVTLVEMMIATFLTAIIAAMMISWIVTVARGDQFQLEAEDSLANMRVAKSRLVKELRFAHAVSEDETLTNAHKVTVWIDSRVQGTPGSPDYGIGEFVTWEILSDGRLVRITDVPGDSFGHMAEGLVYDADAAEGSSYFAYPAPDAVSITLVADVDSSSGPDPQTIRTEVVLRNA